MLLKNVKIGDTLEVYLDDEGYVTASVSRSTLKAVVIAYSEEYDEYIIGFKGNENRPQDAYVRRAVSGPTHFKYIDNHADYIYAYRMSVCGGRWHVANIEKDVSNWQHWRTQKKGECPCGSNYGVCTYHPAPVYQS